MEAGFISEFEVNNKKAWNGTINFLCETLSKEYELCPIVVKQTFVQKCFKKMTRLGLIYRECFFIIAVNCLFFGMCDL